MCYNYPLSRNQSFFHSHNFPIWVQTKCFMDIDLKSNSMAMYFLSAGAVASKAGWRCVPAGPSRALTERQTLNETRAHTLLATSQPWILMPTLHLEAQKRLWLQPSGTVCHVEHCAGIIFISVYVHVRKHMGHDHGLPTAAVCSKVAV